MSSETTGAIATAPALEPVEAPGIASYPDLNALLAALEHERIEALAYSFWQERGCPEGSPDEDWLRAEQHIRQSH
ncbi:MAG: DUF2934 domain-containing protein [Bryobacteraceae bacterium]|jgi:hypothetical protein